MTVAALRPLGRRDLRRATVLLARNPERDVYLRGLIWRLGVSLPESAGQLLGWFEGEKLTGVFLHAPVLVLACEDEDGLAAFARFVAGSDLLVPLSQLVAPLGMADVFLDRLAAQGACPPIRLLRDGLVAQRLGRPSLVSSDALPAVDHVVPAAVRPARQEELGLTGHAALAVTREELGFGVESSEEMLFTAALERRIRAGREYIWTEGRLLLFRAAISAATPEAVLLEGVYVPPEERGRHRGTWAMHALCDRLLRWHRSIVVFVDADNRRAGRVYQRLGFAPFCDFSVVYFEQSTALPTFDPRRQPQGGQ